MAECFVIYIILYVIGIYTRHTYIFFFAKKVDIIHNLFILITINILYNNVTKQCCYLFVEKWIGSLVLCAA